MRDHYVINRQSASRNKVRRLYCCKGCRRQYTVTVGTVFQSSKIPLSKWFAAIFLMTSSKKGVSSHQLYRMLDLGSYRSAWYMTHRIRTAMQDKGLLTKLAGVVEADETYISRRRRRGHPIRHERIQDEIELGLRPKKKPPPYQTKPTIFGMVERGGRVRTMVVPSTTGKTLRPIICETVDLDNATLITDSHPAYRLLKSVVEHHTINHELEYVRGSVHTQTIEGYWSILKRGLYGVYQHVSKRYLSQYLMEFEYRYNRREMSDPERFAEVLTQTDGPLGWFGRERAA